MAYGLGRRSGRTVTGVSVLDRTAQGRALLRHRKKVLALISTYGYRNPVCFGSVARGDADTDSDIDLLVEMDTKQFDPERLQRLAEELERLVGFPVDVATPAFMGETARRYASREAVKL